jgi:hypothetical protein
MAMGIEPSSRQSRALQYNLKRREIESAEERLADVRVRCLEKSRFSSATNKPVTIPLPLSRCAHNNFFVSKRIRSVPKRRTNIIRRQGGICLKQRLLIGTLRHLAND